jgi:phosphoribosylanthranilate isomerase
VIKALRVDENFHPEDVARYGTDAVLLDAFCTETRGGTGKTFDWTVARRARAFVERLYLAGGLSPENVGAAVAAVEPFAVDVCSGVESAAGKKDAARMRAFVAAVREVSG